MSSIDLDAYFRRIGYDGSREPTLDTLRAIHARHPIAIPFENLDPLLRRTPSLDAESLQRKLVDGGRGGWCYEQNGTLREVLESLGFRVDGLAARVIWNRPEGTLTARTHMVLLVHLDEPWIADVGFGGIVLTAPLRLLDETWQTTPHGEFRLRVAGDDRILAAMLGGVVTPIYRFDLQPQHRPDYELPNWYLSTHPDSHFLASLMLARIDGDDRHTLRNGTYTVRRGDTVIEQRAAASVDELRSILTDAFKLTLPDTPALDDALARFVVPPDAPTA